MKTFGPSVSVLAMAMTAMLLTATPAATASLQIKSVGEIFVDAQGRASGENLAGHIADTDGTIASFRSLGLGTMVFESVKIDGFRASEKIQGVGSSALTLRGTNAVVSLHDNIHSILKVHATQPATVRYHLAPGITATSEGAGTVRLAQGGAYVGHLVAVGSAGARTRGETLTIVASDISARLQTGSDLVFLAKPAYATEPTFQNAVIDALARGAVASQYITEFAGSAVATSQLDASEGATTRTTSDVAGSVVTTLSAGARGPNVLVYDLAYETLPAKSADDVAVYVDGELAQRASSAADVLTHAQKGLPSSFTLLNGGRAQVLASSPGEGEHRIVVTVRAQAATEPQNRAERDGEENARVYGGFEYHANGKLTGAFLTSVIPEGRAHLLSFTSLATRTEVFRSISVDDGATATFRASGGDQMRLETPKADLTLVDDAHATMILVAKASVDAWYQLAPDVKARPLGDDLLMLDGPNGPAGALVVIGKGSLHSGSQVRAHLESGATLVYRASPDTHDSEPALLRALAEGRLGAQLLAGVQDGAAVAKSTSYAIHSRAAIETIARGAVGLRYDGDLPFALDARGGALVAKSGGDIRVLVSGVAIAEASSIEDALTLGGNARYHASTSADGALRLIVNTASAAGTPVQVRIESVVEENARAQARTDAFGAFRLFADGRATGSFVSLKADRAAGAVSGLVATGEPLFASLVAGRSPYVTVTGEGASVLRLENREARIEVSDTTNGFTKVVALHDTDAAFRVAAGLHVEQRSPGVVEIVDGEGRHAGSLVAASAATLEARGTDEVRAQMSKGGELAFRTHAGIESELSAAQRIMINEAIATGRIGGQVFLQTQASAAATERDLESTARTESEGLKVGAKRAYGEITSSVSASYGDLELVTSATKSRVDITVSSATHMGKTLLISLDPETIPGMATGKASIRFDGEFVGQASSYADILDASDDAGFAEYFVLAGDAGTQILVSIPSFSVHTVTLEQKETKTQPAFIYATIILGALVLVQSVILARKARNNKIIDTRRP